MRGLRMSVLRPADHGDCTRDGVTSRYTSVVLLDEQMEGYIDPEPGAGNVMVVDRRFNLLGGGKEYPVARPAEFKDGKWVALGDSVGWWGFGGNYLETCDSRFREAGFDGPIPVHDRCEPWRK